MIENLKGFGNTKFKIKEIEFSIVKLPPMSGFKVAEQIRINLVKTADDFEAGEGSEKDNVVLFFKSILALPTNFIEYLMSELFENVQFTGNDAGVDKGWAKLKGLEDMAFKDFETINIYEVLGRALYVNFFGSFSGITSAFPGVEQFLKQQIQKT